MDSLMTVIIHLHYWTELYEPVCAWPAKRYYQVLNLLNKCSFFKKKSEKGNPFSFQTDFSRPVPKYLIVTILFCQLFLSFSYYHFIFSIYIFLADVI